MKSFAKLPTQPLYFIKKDKLFTNENCVISVGNLEKDFPVYKFDPDAVICHESTELIFNNLNCIPGFCYAQIPDHNLISRWINQLIEIARNSKIDDWINITKNNVAKHWHLLLKKITTLCLIKKFVLHLKMLKIMTFYVIFTLLSSTVIVLRIFTNVMMEKGIAA